MDYRNDPKALRLYWFLSSWTQANPGWAYDCDPFQHVRRVCDAEALASELLAAAEASELQLAGLLKTPDGELIQTVIGWMIPWPASGEFKLLVDAVTLAAAAKQRDQRTLAGALTVAAAFILGLVLIELKQSG
jgi:hypothetical protein